MNLGKKRDRYFVSELDQFLTEFDADHPEKSASQLADIKKHARIFKLRDEAKGAQTEDEKIWSAF